MDLSKEIGMHDVLKKRGSEACPSFDAWADNGVYSERLGIIVAPEDLWVVEANNLKLYWTRDEFEAFKMPRVSKDESGDYDPLGGWRLPTAGTGGELAVLNNTVNGGVTNRDTGLVSFPNNFIYSGDFNQTQSGGRGNYGRLWSATASNNNNAFRLGYRNNEVTPVKAYNKWDAFALRCIVKP